MRRLTPLALIALLLAGCTGPIPMPAVTSVPSPGRITLFDGVSLNGWVKADGAPASWPVADGSAEALGGDIRSVGAFQDFRLHLEFLIPQLPPTAAGQHRGNSGIYLQDRYELQVLDSYQVPTGLDQCGAFYALRAPDTNQATAPGTWQSYDITLRTARFAGATKTESARITVVWNGVTVHDDVELAGPTPGGAAENATPGPIRLQDHNDPGANVRYRAIWVEPLS